MKNRYFEKLVLPVALLLGVCFQLSAAFTDLKPDSSPVTKYTSTCELFTNGSCHKEQTDSCKCVDCPGLQEDLPHCDCKQEKGTAYWQAWDGTCVGEHIENGVFLYHCEWPSEPQQSGDKANQPTCGRAT